MKVEINIQTQNEKRDLTCQQHLGEWDVPLGLRIPYQKNLISFGNSFHLMCQILVMFIVNKRKIWFICK